jgi:hypothetical protein
LRRTTVEVTAALCGDAFGSRSPSSATEAGLVGTPALWANEDESDDELRANCNAASDNAMPPCGVVGTGVEFVESPCECDEAAEAERGGNTIPEPACNEEGPDRLRALSLSLCSRLRVPPPL